MFTHRHYTKTTKLTKQELRNVKNLVQICEKADGYKARFYWNVLRERQLPEFDDFLYYIEGKLVGYLALFVFKESKAEINAVVHPDYRQKGLFKFLLYDAGLELKRRNIPLADFICYKDAKVPLSILEKYDATFKHTECEMLAKRKPILTDLPEVTLRQATLQDVQQLAEIDSACFHTNIRRMTYRITQNMKEAHRRAWLLEHKGQVVGKTHVRFEDDEIAFIHDLGVPPQHQKKGFARAMVMALREVLAKEGYAYIALDVLGNNEAAIKLYHHCGFDLVAEHQFWEFNVSKLLESPLTSVQIR